MITTTTTIRFHTHIEIPSLDYQADSNTISAKLWQDGNINSMYMYILEERTKVDRLTSIQQMVMPYSSHLFSMLQVGFCQDS